MESVFALKDFNVEVICDGIHVPPVLVREIFNAKGVDNMCLITDSLAVSAIPEGSDVDPGIIDPRTIIEDGVCNFLTAVHWLVLFLRWTVLCVPPCKKRVSLCSMLAA